MSYVHPASPIWHARDSRVRQLCEHFELSSSRQVYERPPVQPNRAGRPLAQPSAGFLRLRSVFEGVAAQVEYTTAPRPSLPTPLWHACASAQPRRRSDAVL